MSTENAAPRVEREPTPDRLRRLFTKTAISDTLLLHSPCLTSREHVCTVPYTRQRKIQERYTWTTKNRKHFSSHVAVEQPRPARSPGNRRDLGRRRRHGRQRRASGEVAAAADANAGQARVEVVAVEVQKSQQQGARVHLAGLFLKIPSGGHVEARVEVGQRFSRSTCEAARHSVRYPDAS